MMAAASTAQPHDHHDEQEYQKSSIRIPQTVFWGLLKVAKAGYLASLPYPEKANPVIMVIMTKLNSIYIHMQSWILKILFIPPCWWSLLNAQALHAEFLWLHLEELQISNSFLQDRRSIQLFSIRDYTPKNCDHVPDLLMSYIFHGSIANWTVSRNLTSCLKPWQWRWFNGTTFQGIRSTPGTHNIIFIAVIIRAQQCIDFFCILLER